MLSKTHRFHGYNALNFAHTKGQVVRGQNFSLKYALNTRRQTYRVAVVVSKKVSKSAVVRNRIRRRIFEAIRQQAKAIKEPYDLIVMVYSADTATMPSQELATHIQSQLQKAGVITSVTDR